MYILFMLLFYGMDFRMAEETQENKTQHLHILMAPSEVEAIDNWGFNNRIRTRAEAIRRLCQIGLVFDDHRVPLVNRVRALSDKIAESTAIMEKLKTKQGLSDLEIDLMIATAQTVQALLPVLPLIRTTTGLANNFKEDRAIEEIMREAQEVIENMGEWLKDIPTEERVRSVKNAD